MTLAGRSVGGRLAAQEHGPEAGRRRCGPAPWARARCGCTRSADAARSTAAASKPSWTVSGVPVRSARVTTDRPPTWASGRQASHRSTAGSMPRRALVASAEAAHRGVGEDDGLRRAVGPARGHDESVARLDGEVGPGRREHGLASRAGQARDRGAARRRPPSHAPLQRLHEPGPDRLEHHQPVHAGSVGACRGDSPPMADAPLRAPADRLAVVARRGPSPHAARRRRARGGRHGLRRRATGRSSRGGRWPPASVALLLQIGTNFANDYSDGVRGTDAPGRRVGPVRLVGWGIQPPGAVKRAARRSASRRGARRAGPGGRRRPGADRGRAPRPSRPGWFYTGGQHPYGYYGFGELFVFVFFGLVATVGIGVRAARAADAAGASWPRCPSGCWPRRCS